MEPHPYTVPSLRSQHEMMIPMTMTGMMVMMMTLHKDHAGTRTVAYPVSHRYKLVQYLVIALFAH